MPCRSAVTSIMQNTGTAGPEIVIDVVTSLERDVAEQHVHVGGGVDRDAAVADLAEALRVVGVAAHQRRHVEGHREPAAAAVEDHLVALVGLLRVAEAGELADRPGAAAVAGGVEPAGERELAGPLAVVGAVRRLDLDAGQRGEVRLPDPRLLVALLPAVACGRSAMLQKIVGRPTKSASSRSEVAGGLADRPQQRRQRPQVVDRHVGQREPRGHQVGGGRLDDRPSRVGDLGQHRAAVVRVPPAYDVPGRLAAGPRWR